MSRFYPLFLICLFACQPDDSETVQFEEVNFAEVTTLLSAESHDQIGQPANLHYSNSGLILYDYSAQSVFLFDDNGEETLRFGSEGDGPGEFRYIAGLWKKNDQYIAYDRNSGKLIHYNTDGLFVKETPLDLEAMPLSMSLLTENEIYVPANGFEGSLIRRITLQNNSTVLLGESLMGDDYDFDFDRSQQEILSGKIPPTMINRLILSSNESGLFSFQQATAVLQKYSHSQELLWEVNLSDIPATEGIFDRFIEINQSFADRGMRNMYMIQHASDITAADSGVFLLMNTIPERASTVVWVSNQGDRVVSAYLPETDNFNPDLIAVSHDGADIYLGSRMDGVVVKMSWPI
ncbi:6-bladed beta-propeller [Rhodohalobacter mucosus]|uniref:6-bladed beta-propeller protein n=1 Tax=Rhodohalobacter mucosus TaxID=2079485 RepID=A0A316U049_9BACT|nr:6-bladed beta-propeller [Rhodohalobacter mucosus]PWN05976.1 hypothetical protein DDZ15_12405 [Rhodohalobacter mucosus]